MILLTFESFHARNHLLRRLVAVEIEINRKARALKLPRLAEVSNRIAAEFFEF